MIKKNIIIFTPGVYLLSAIGAFLISRGEDIGGLIFIISPILMVTLLRSTGGDG